MKKNYDVVIAGSGPSALSLAQKIAEEGLSTLVVSPNIEQRWVPNYASWFSDIDELGLSICVEESWVSPMVFLDDNSTFELPFRYAKISTNRLQTLLEYRSRRSGVHFLCNSVSSVQHQETYTSIFLSDEQIINGRIFVDATGSGEFLARKKPMVPRGYQSAYGILLEVESNPWERGEMSLMDYRIPSGLTTEQQEMFLSSPTFLYALPLGKNLLFLEETSLVSLSPLSFDELKRRLHVRMSAMNIALMRILEEEKCIIPMGGSRPLIDQRTLGFGAAAGLVHPATGYQLSYSMSLAPVVAQAIAMGLEEGSVEEAVRLAWLQIWPKEQRRCWDMYQFGMELLCSLSTAQTHDFFRAFFSIPADSWRRFLCAKATPTEVSKAMAQVFMNGSFSLQKTLINSAVQKNGLKLMRSVFGLSY